MLFLKIFKPLSYLHMFSYELGSQWLFTQEPEVGGSVPPKNFLCETGTEKDTFIVFTFSLPEKQGGIKIKKILIT